MKRISNVAVVPPNKIKMVAPIAVPRIV